MQAYRNAFARVVPRRRSPRPTSSAPMKMTLSPAGAWRVALESPAASTAASVGVTWIMNPSAVSVTSTEQPAFSAKRETLSRAASLSIRTAKEPPPSASFSLVLITGLGQASPLQSISISTFTLPYDY